MALKNPPPSELSILIAICDATVPLLQRATRITNMFAVASQISRSSQAAGYALAQTGHPK